MILTLTCNPAMDQTVWVDRYVPGTVHRVRETQLDPAGKGINVARMAHRLGAPTVAFGFAAGEIGQMLEKSLDAEQVQHHFVRVPGQSRIDTTVVDGAGVASSFYGGGPTVAREHLDALFAHFQAWLPIAGVVVLAGSLAPGAPDNFYADYIKAARARGAFVILDAHGAALQRGLEARPDLIKPNLVEAEGLLGRHLSDQSAVEQATRELGERAGTAIISMGARGALCVTGSRVLRIVPPRVKQTSSVGSGDAMLAGIAVAISRGRPLVDGLRLGAAAGAATAMARGTKLGTAKQVEELMEAVTVEEVVV